MSNNWYEKRKINQSHVLYERLTNKLLNQKFNILKEMKGEDLVKRLRDAVTNAGGVSVSTITPQVFLNDLDAVIGNTKNTPQDIASAKKLKSLLDNNRKAQLWLDAHAQAVADGDAGAVSRLFKDPELELRTQYAVNDFSKVGREPESVSPVSPKSQETGRVVPQNVTSRSQEQIEDLVQDVASSEDYYKKIKSTAGNKVKQLYKIHTDNGTKPLDKAEFYTALNKLLTDAGAPKKYDMAELTLIFGKEIVAVMPLGKNSKEWADLTNQLGLTIASLPVKVIKAAAEGVEESIFVKRALSIVLGVAVFGGAGYVGYSMFTADIATFNRMDCTSTLVSGAKSAEYKKMPQYIKCEILARKILASNPIEEQDIKDKIDFKKGLNAFSELKPLVKDMEAPASAAEAPASAAEAPAAANALTWQNAPDESTAKFVDQGNKWNVYKKNGSWYYKKDKSIMDAADLKGITEIVPPK